MKNLLFTIFTFALLLITTFSFAQIIAPPEGINYQAIARDTAGKPMINISNLNVTFNILDSNSILPGPVISVYKEKHSSVTTNRYGLFTLVIGKGTPVSGSGSFSDIIWVIGDKFLEVTIDTGGTGSLTMPKTQLMSVPYALHSKYSIYAFGNWGLEGNDDIDISNFIGTTNNNPLRFKTNDSLRMIIGPLGNVGIGTLSPAPDALLEVAGKIKITDGSQASGNVLTSDANGLATWTLAPTFVESFTGTVTDVFASPPLSSSGGTAPTISISANALNSDGYVSAPVAGDTYKVWKTDSLGNPGWRNDSILSYWTKSGNNIYNNDTIGNVGIGTALPATSKLTVYEGGASPTLTNFTQSLTNAGLQISTNSTGSGDYTPGLFWQTTNNGSPTKPQAGIWTYQSGSGSKIFMGTSNTYSNGITNTDFVLDQNGNVGIGTTIPDANAKLDVAGQIKITDGTQGFGKVLTSDANGLATWEPLPITPVTVTSIVGTSPISAVSSGGGSIYTISVAQNSASAAGVVAAPVAGDTYKVWKIDGSGNPAWRTDSTTAYNAGTGLTLSGTTFNSVWTASGTNIYSNNSGNVGIGITAPTAKLHLNKTGAGDGFLSYTNGTGGAGNFQISNVLNASDALYATTNGSGNAIQGFASSGGNAIYAVNNGTGKVGYFQITNVTNSADALYVNTDGTGKAGNFVINNASNPSTTLSATTNGSGNAVSAINTGTGKAGFFQISDTSSTADALYVGTNGSNSKALKVFHYGSNGAGIDYGAYVESSGSRAGGTTNVGGYFTAKNAGNNYAAIFDQGNVGIGTTVPDANAKLHVAGQIKITGGSPGANKVLTSDGTGLATWAMPATNGTVTSVGLTLPDIFTVTGTPVTTSGILTGTLVNQNAGFVLAGPSSGNGTPTFRALINTDLPGAFSGFANPTTSVGLTAISGTATTAMRSDAAPALSQAIVPTWTGKHTFSNATYSALFTGGNVGIGTGIIAPEAKLHIIKSNSSTIYPFKIGNDNQPGLEWFFDVDGAANMSFGNEGNFTAMYFANTTGNVGIGTTAPGSNARLAIKDGHLQSQQTTKPGTAAVNTSSQAITNATDVAGNISFTPSGVIGSVTVTFNMSYSVAPTVIITPTNSVSATDTPYVWVTSTLSGFTVNFSSAFISFTSHTYSYHVIETTTN